MRDENSLERDRYEFVRDEIQLIIQGEYQNAKMTDWRKWYQSQNEGHMLIIADKVKNFFEIFQNKALESVDYPNIAIEYPNTASWYERFGWRDFIVTWSLRRANLQVKEIAMYIEHQIEFEEIYLSARERRYMMREMSKLSSDDEDE